MVHAQEHKRLICMNRAMCACDLGFLFACEKFHKRRTHNQNNKPY